MERSLPYIRPLHVLPTTHGDQLAGNKIEVETSGTYPDTHLRVTLRQTNGDTMMRITLAQARRMASWLEDAADTLEGVNTPPDHGPEFI